MRPPWTARAALERWKKGLLDLLLPPACAGCGAASEDALCASCHRSLPWIAEEACEACQARPPLPDATRCAGCIGRRTALARCTATCWFEGAAAAWIRDYKYGRGGLASLGSDRARIRALALALARRAPADPPDRVVPVPLHRRRLRERGFNPACEIARRLARERGARLAPVALERVRDTPSQTRLDRRARLRNVRGAFRAAEAPAQTVWLVDDVVTTGATLEAAARALRRAGARRVIGLCLARASALDQASGAADSAARPTDSAIT